MNNKLSILQRQSDKPGWDISSPFTPTDISTIRVFNAKTDKSLNAIPSPLSRLYLFESAIELVDKDEINKTNLAGDVYRKIVSDCFDILELVYNWNIHKRDNQPLELVVWKVNENLEKLKNSNNKRHKLLAESLEVFMKDSAFEGIDEFLLVKFNGKVIAGSSPFTGFFTSPNDINFFQLHNPTSNRNYFSKIELFDKRSPEIKKYIINFFKTSDILSKRANSVINYISRYEGEITNEIDPELEDLVGQNKSLFGTTLKSSSKKGSGDYLEDYLIRVNFRFNEECFFVPTNDKIDREYDYLYPLRSECFKDPNFSDKFNSLKIRETDKDTVKVCLKVGDKEFQRYYNKKKINDHDGTIIDLHNDHSIKFNLGIFPFVKTDRDEFNDFYKVLFVLQDNNYIYGNEDFKVGFGIGDALVSDETDSAFSLKIDHRTILEKDRTAVGSTFYSLKSKSDKSVCFKFLQIKFPKICTSEIRGIIIPKWRDVKIGDRQIDYSIDFGTTSTFIAYTEDVEHKTKPNPFAFHINSSDRKIPVEFLNSPKKKTDDLLWIDCFEEFSLKEFFESVSVQKQEFIPSLLNKERHKIPFRSVIYRKEGIMENQIRLFSNSNIAFTYQKEDNFATSRGQQYLSNLKWDINQSTENKKYVEVFIEEIFYLMRTRCLFDGGDPKKSRIVWFSPLSFTVAMQNDYRKIWESKFKEVFKHDPTNTQLQNVTESEAPFYFHSKDATINNESSILTIDIGGGTTDIMYLQDKSPKICSSFHFGANLLWGNGYNEFRNSKINGIFETISKEINTNLQSTELKALNESLIKDDSPYGADEIMNFWIMNNDKSEVLKKLDDGRFRLSYMLHLSAIVYHSFKTIEKFAKDSPPPTCIIFSGNGSKYLDLIASQDHIERVCGYFLKNVFGSLHKNPQIILPKENRKEATCFGGLYMPPENNTVHKPVNFLGFESEADDIKTYTHLENSKNENFDKLEGSLSQFIELFFAMNESDNLSFWETFGIKADITMVKNILKSKIREYLELGYSKKVIGINKDDRINDSMFFLPIIGMVFNLNKLKELEPMEIQYFANSFDSDKGFMMSSIAKNVKPDSVYLIKLEDEDSKVGSLYLVETSTSFKRLLSSVKGYLEPLCTFKEHPSDSNHKIRVIKPGVVERDGKSWKLMEKMEIEFI